MRAKVVPLILADGWQVQANLYSYAYRLTSYWPGDRGYRSYKLTEENTERNAQRAFDQLRSGYVIVGDMEKGGRASLDGHTIYKDVTAPLWFDTERFPGTLVGWVEARGNVLHVSDRTKWTTGSYYKEESQTWQAARWRSLMINGRAEQERQDIL